MTDELAPMTDEFAPAIDPAEREAARARREEAAIERGTVRQLALQLAQEMRMAQHSTSQAEVVGPRIPIYADCD